MKSPGIVRGFFLYASQFDFVMAGFIPAIHVLTAKQGVDARNKCGHDGGSANP